jgi:TolB-like protein
LAFKNLSGDPKQESFSDGVSQEIIMALSSVDWLMVVARGSSFTYKDADIDIRRIGDELGVQYVVTGTVRRARSRVRISVQLIDVRNGNHIWAERYDDETGDIFDLQEQIAKAIAANVDSRLKLSERKDACRTREHLTVWEKYQDALWHIYRATDDHTEIAFRRLDEIIEEAPEYSPALATWAILVCRRITYCQYDDPKQELREADRIAKRALSLDENNSVPRIALSRVLMFQGHYDGAIEQARQAVTLNPSSSLAATCLGWACYWSGQASEAVDVIDGSIRLSPKGPFLDMKVTIKVFSLHALDRIDEAEILGRQVCYSVTTGPIGVLAYLAVLGRQKNFEEAEAALDILRDNWPDVSLGRIRKSWLHLHPDYLSGLLNDLEAAGLPEQA